MVKLLARKTVVIIIGIAIIFTLIGCGLIAYMAVSHNPTETYCKYINYPDCSIVWGNLLPLLAHWFGLIFIASLMLLFALTYLQFVIKNIIQKIVK